MELTLTGASLNPETPASRSERNAQNNKSNKISNEKLTKNSHIDHNSRKETTKSLNLSQVTSHLPAISASSQGACPHGSDCCKAPAHSLPRPESLQIEKLLSTPYVLFSAITSAIKGGSYDSFEYLASAVLKHEAKKGNFLLSEFNPTSNDSSNDISENVSGLGRRGEGGHTLAHWAAKRGDDFRFMEYLTKIPNINLNLPSTDSVGMRPLHWASTQGSIRIVSMILKHMDSRSGNASISSETISDIIDKNDPINSRDKSGCTPLLIAAQYGHADLSAFLIKRGADPNSVDDSRDTALHWAAYKGSVPVCGLLLYLNGVREHLDLQDAFGQSPLHLASLRGNTEVLTYLLSTAELYIENQLSRRQSFQGKGLSVGGSRHDNSTDSRTLSTFIKKILSLKDRDGKTPLDLATKKKNTGCEHVLRKFMTKYSTINNSYFSKIARMIMPFFSLGNWKTWFGISQGRSDSVNSPKFIFWWVVCNMLTALIIEVTVYVPLWSRGKGIMWDYTFLHLATIFAHCSMWVSFYLVNKTDPGILSKHDMHLSLDKGRNHLRSSEISSRNSEDEHSLTEKKMKLLTVQLRIKYEDTLESLAKDGCERNDADLSLCHSCHIAKPLRSKHCRVLNKCVLLFDHHCPFVGKFIKRT